MQLQMAPHLGICFSDFDCGPQMIRNQNVSGASISISKTIRYLNYPTRLPKWLPERFTKDTEHRAYQFVVPAPIPPF